MIENFSVLDLTRPEFYIALGGLWLVIFIVFAETGLFAGFFLPGDSLLFVSGIYGHELVSSSFKVENPHLAIWILVLLTALSAFLGNIVGYKIGGYSKTFFEHTKDRWFYKKKYLDQAREFYHKHGGMAVSFARFIPVVRTFVPVVSGIVGMRFSMFLVYSLIGGLLWPLLLQMTGFYLNSVLLSQFGVDIKKYIEVIVIGIVVVSTAPVVWGLLKRKRT